MNEVKKHFINKPSITLLAISIPIALLLLGFLITGTYLSQVINNGASNYLTIFFIVLLIVVYIFGAYFLYKEPMLTVTDNKIILESWGNILLHKNKTISFPFQKVDSHEMKQKTWRDGIEEGPYMIHLWNKDKTKKYTIRFWYGQYLSLRKQFVAAGLLDR